MELKAIAPYLAHGVKVLAVNSGVWELSIDGMSSEKRTVGLEWVFGMNAMKPILRPLTDLTKPCLEGGKIPIMELAKIAFKNIYTTEPEILKHEVLTEGDNSGFIGWTPDERISLTHNKDFNRNSFSFYIAGNEMHTDQLSLFNYLFEHHFDVFDLISKGEAIDINTL